MNKRVILIICLIFLSTLAFNALSKDTTVAKNTLLYVKDPAGENFLVLKVDSCDLGNGGELICAMGPKESATAIQAGPKNDFWAKQAYPD